jgi:hypothetical protein
MSEQNPGSGADAPVATPAVPAATPAAPVEETAAPSKGDWAGMAKSMRSVAETLPQMMSRLEALEGKGKAPPAPAPPASDAMAAVEELRTELALRDAFDAHKVAAGNPLRELIATAVKASRPADVSAFVAKYAPAAAPASVAAATTPPVAKSDAGAPAASPAQANLPADPRRWPADVVAKMSNEAFRAELEKYEATQGRRNPFSHLRKPGR